MQCDLRLSNEIGLSEVERAFVHVDYEGEHSVVEEHKPPYELQTGGNGENFVTRVKSNMFRLPWTKRAGGGGMESGEV